MAEPRTPPTAAQRVAGAPAGALALASLLPQAARIERRLLRALRLQLLPHGGAADEADLWASDLVELRALDGLVLRADVQELLRQRGRTVLQRRRQGDDAERLRRAHQLLLEHHANLPPLVQLEEEIAWLAMAETRPERATQAKLEVALAALVRDGRVGVARWAARAVPRLPAVAQGTTAAWQLAVASSSRLPPGSRVALASRGPVGIVDLKALAPQLGQVALGVRRLGDRLELGAVGPGGLALMVPASEPRFVQLSVADGEPMRELAVASGALETVAGIGWAPLTLVSADDRQWRVPVLSADEERWLADAAQHALPVADDVPAGARVVCLSLGSRQPQDPVVGTWGDDTDMGPNVLARTVAEPARCVGAPVVHEGRLAGTVTRAYAEPDREGEHDDARWVRLLVSRRPPAAAMQGVVVELLPASNGAAVLIGWGPAESRRYLLVDAGPAQTATSVLERVRARVHDRLELLAVSHADADRVQGATQLLQSGLRPGDVWFNGPQQLASRFGVRGAHSVAVERLVGTAGRLNGAFDGLPIVVPPEGPLPRIELPGGASITVLAPDDRALAALAPSWNRDAAKRSMSKAASTVDEFPAEETEEKPTRRPLKFGGDHSVNNGASLVLLFEYQGRSVLLPGDTHAATLVNALRRLAAERGRAGIYVDVFVLPHGGSRGNITPELFDVLEAGTCAVSTDGSRFGHPDPETIDLVARRAQGATLAFNYRRKTTERWASASFQREHRVQVVLPDDPEGGVTLELQTPMGQSAA